MDYLGFRYVVMIGKNVEFGILGCSLKLGCPS